MFDEEKGYSFPADVFGFSMILADATCGGFENTLIGAPTMAYLSGLRQGVRPVMPESDGSGINRLVAFMWRYDEKGRPSAGQVKERLKEIMDSNRNG